MSGLVTSKVNQIFSIGKDENFDDDQNQKIGLQNKIVLTLLLFSLFHVIHFYFYGFSQVSLKLFFVPTGFGICLFLNYLKQYTFSKYLLIIVSVVAIFYFSIVFGKQSGIYINLLSIAIIPLILFKDEFYFHRVITTGLPCVAYILLESSEYQSKRLIVLDDSILHIINQSMFMTTFFVFILVVIYFLDMENQSKNYVHESHSTLIRGISHELNNPLGILSLNMESLKMHTDSPDKILSISDSALRAINRIDHLTSQMLSYSSNPKEERVIEDIDFNEISEHFIELSKYLCTTKNINIITDLNSSIILKANKYEIEQIFSNLLVNSIEAIPETGGTIHISLNTLSPLEYRCKGKPSAGIEIKFQDDGIGLKEENQNKVFNAFFTTKHKNTGLGLSIVNKIVLKYHGEITLDSLENQGTTVRITFPI